MADWDFILAPATVVVEVTLDEVAVVNNTVKMIKAAGHESHLSGLHSFVQEVADSLSQDDLNQLQQIIPALDGMVIKANARNYAEFLKAIPDMPESVVSDGTLGWMREKDNYPGDDAVLGSLDTYIGYARQCVSEKYAKKEKDEEFELEYWESQWQAIKNPRQLIEDAHRILSYLWANHLQAEWKRVKPMLEEAVSAFHDLDLDGMSPYEAIETITGRNMRGRDFFEDSLEEAERLIFMPSAHLGPYISWADTGIERTMLFFFTARAPKNSSTASTALSRNELLVRLNALADETRLKMLEMLSEHEELCAQDFITGLDLSQSSASRHLRQLTASGYLNERRRDVAKCYSINPDRIDDTIQALKIFLKKS